MIAVVSSLKPIDFDALLTLVEQYDSRSRQHGG
jgi:hypothetical protein